MAFASPTTSWARLRSYVTAAIARLNSNREPRPIKPHRRIQKAPVFPHSMLSKTIFKDHQYLRPPYWPCSFPSFPRSRDVVGMNLLACSCSQCCLAVDRSIVFSPRRATGFAWASTAAKHKRWSDSDERLSLIWGIKGEQAHLPRSACQELGYRFFRSSLSANSHANRCNQRCHPRVMERWQYDYAQLRFGSDLSRPLLRYPVHLAESIGETRNNHTK